MPHHALSAARTKLYALALLVMNILMAKYSGDTCNFSILGFFCPENMSQPVYCCEGYYCPADSNYYDVADENGLGAWGNRIKICPEGSYCMNGQVDPFDCNALSTCPEGSSKANKGGTIALLVALTVLIYIAFLIRYAIQKRKREIQDKLITQEVTGENNLGPTVDNRDNAMQSLEVASGVVMGDKNDLREILTENHSPFHIKFENLGLKLKSGMRIMEGVYGEFKPGRMCAVMGSSGTNKSLYRNTYILTS